MSLGLIAQVFYCQVINPLTVDRLYPKNETNGFNNSLICMVWWYLRDIFLNRNLQAPSSGLHTLWWHRCGMSSIRGKLQPQPCSLTRSRSGRRTERSPAMTDSRSINRALPYQSWHSAHITYLDQRFLNFFISGLELYLSIFTRWEIKMEKCFFKVCTSSFKSNSKLITY